MDFDSFALNGSFIVSVIGNKTASRLPITPQPSDFDGSSLCEFIRESFPKGLSLTQLLVQIEDDHKDSPCLYLVKRKVVLVPGEDVTKPIERVQLLRNLIAQIFTPTQVETSAQGHAKIAVGTITSWQKFVLTSVLNHFHKLLLNDEYYKTEELRKQFFQHVFSLFIPVSLQTVPVRIAAPVDLYKGDLTVTSPKDLCIIVKSPNDITVLSPDTMTWPAVEYDEASYVDGNLLHLKSVDSGKYVDFICHAPISAISWRQILWPSAAPQRTSIQSVIQSCKSFSITPKNKQINAAAATGLARVVSSIDNSFSLAFYATFKADNKVFEKILKAMLILFISEHREMQLLKLVAYFELNRTIDLNEMFRKNNNYFRTITFYVNLVSDSYKTSTIQELYRLIAAADMWSFDNPNEKDLETVDNLISQFFIILTEQVDKIPATVRSFCRYLRLLSERKFQDTKLVFRPIYAVFLLRFIFPLLCAPMDLGITKINNKDLAKVVQFTKLLAFAGQNQHLIGEHQGGRVSMNKVIDKNAPLVTKFYEALTQEYKGDSSHVTKDEVIESAMIFKDYVIENEKALSEYKPYQLFENIYVDELLTEFVSSTLQQP